MTLRPTSSALSKDLRPGPSSERAAERPIKRSFSIAGHKTSISLEVAFWAALREVAVAEQASMAELVRRIDGQRGGANLSSAVRVWLLERYRGEAAAANRPAEPGLR